MNQSAQPDPQPRQSLFSIENCFALRNFENWVVRTDMNNNNYLPRLWVGRVDQPEDPSLHKFEPNPFCPCPYQEKYEFF